MKERDIQNSIRLKFSRGNTRLFVNDQGVAEINGRTMRYGLGVGTSDLIGVQTVTITKDMVGRQLGVAVFAEVKTEKGIVKPHQAAFLQQMAKMGAISGVVRSLNDMEKLLESVVNK